MPRYSLTILCLLLASTAPVLPEGVGAESRARATAEAMDELVRYTVQPGDTLEGLATRHFVDPKNWKKAQTLNSLNDGAALIPGSTLVFRQSWLKASPIRAEIAAYRGEVGTVSGAIRTSASVGLTLDEGDLVETGANGFVTLRLPDDSLVTLPSNSRIRLSRLRSVSLTQSIDRRFLLEAGRSEAQVTHMTNPASKFMITTPVSVAAVRGTKFRVSFVPAEMKALEEVLEGKVAVGPKGEPSGKPGETLLLPGYGAVATRDGISGAIELLGAPSLDKPGMAQTGKTVTFRLKPLPGAAVYLVELSTDAAFVDRFAAIETGKTDISFAGVPNGSLHVRIAARDTNGLTGVPVAYAFERRFAGSAASADDGTNTSSKAGGKASTAKVLSSKDAPLAAAASADGSSPAVQSFSDYVQKRAKNAVESAATSEVAADAESEVEEGDAAWDSDEAPSGDLFGGGFGEGGGGGSSGGSGGGSAGGGSSEGPAGGGGAGSDPGLGSGGSLPDQPPLIPAPPALPPLFAAPTPAPSPPLPPSGMPAFDAAVPAPPGLESGNSGALPGIPALPPEPSQPAGAVPEPAAWALLIGGFGLVGLALRRQRRGSGGLVRRLKKA